MALLVVLFFGFFFLVILMTIIGIATSNSGGRGVSVVRYSTLTDFSSPVRVEIEAEGIIFSWGNDVEIGSSIEYEATVDGETLRGQIPVNMTPFSTTVATSRRATKVRTRILRSTTTASSTFNQDMLLMGVLDTVSRSDQPTSDSNWSTSESISETVFTGGSFSDAGGFSGSADYSSSSSDFSGGSSFSGGGFDAGSSFDSGSSSSSSSSD